MLILGEKYACEACVRGHRVSNCQHADRPLTHINKKGRPVSQCAHCRTLRKSRSAHVKCDCGEKVHNKTTCTQTKEAEFTGELWTSNQAASNPDSDSTADACCCSHGGRCSCSLKKEHLDPVPESDDSDAQSSLPTPPSETKNSRARAHTVHSEGSGLTVFMNGHHKPVKHNHMAHKCGLPYTVPRAHSIHGQSPSGLANRSVDNLPHTNAIDALHSDSHIKDSIVSAQAEQRMVKSEHNSPVIGSVSTLETLNAQLPPLDLSVLDEYPNEFSFPMSYDGFPGCTDIEAPIFSAGLPSAASIDWSHYDGLEFNNINSSFAPSTFSQPPSYNGFEFSSIDQPALTTTSTSGEISEVEDFAQFNDVAPIRPTLARQFGSEFESDIGDTEKYRLSTASSFIGMPQAQMIASNDIGSLDIDEFIKDVASNNYRTSNSSSADGFVSHDGLPGPVYNGSYDGNTFQMPSNEEDEALWMATFTANQGLNNTSITSEPQNQHQWTQ